MQRSGHHPAKSRPSYRDKVGGNSNSSGQEHLVNVIKSAEFQPLCEPYKSGLYAEKDLIKSIIEGSNELLANIQDENGKKIFKENQTFSNFAILTGLIAATSGLFCFFLPFNTTSKFTILALALLYGSLITILSVIESCITETIVATVKPNGVANSESLYILAHLDIDSKQIRLLIAPYKGIWSTLRSIRGNPLHLLQTLCGQTIFSWLIQALSSKRQPEVGKESSKLVEHSKQDGKLEWMDINCDIGCEFRATVDIVKGGVQPPYSLKGNKKNDDHISTRVLLMEKPLTRYFDTNGFLLGKSMAEDLRELLTVFFDR